MGATDKIQQQRTLEYPIFTSFKVEELKAATAEQLKEWSLRLRNELKTRQADTKEDKTPRGRKRVQEN